jgi:hypothetical protein
MRSAFVIGYSMCAVSEGYAWQRTVCYRCEYRPT